MKRNRRLNKKSKLEANEESPSPVAEVEKQEEETTVGSRFLAFHITPDQKGNVQIGATSIDCTSGLFSFLGRTIAWEGEFGFIANLVLDLTKKILLSHMFL